MQFELFSVFLQKDLDCLFFLQSKWWPCIDHVHFLYLTACFCFLFVFQTSACFTDGHRVVVSIPSHSRKSNFQCQEWARSPPMPAEPPSKGRVWERQEPSEQPPPRMCQSSVHPSLHLSQIYPTENFSQSTEWEEWFLSVIVCSKLVLHAKAFRFVGLSEGWVMASQQILMFTPQLQCLSVLVSPQLISLESSRSHGVHCSTPESHRGLTSDSTTLPKIRNTSKIPKDRQILMITSL